jgi:hypothetical protein
MSRVLFFPLPFTMGDRESLMSFDKQMCDKLEPLQQFARPAMLREIPSKQPGRERFNVTFVRKITKEFRFRTFGEVSGIDLTKIGFLDLDDESKPCLICGTRTEAVAVYMPFNVAARCVTTGESAGVVEYAFCTECAKSPDSLEKVEIKLGISE